VNGISVANRYLTFAIIKTNVINLKQNRKWSQNNSSFKLIKSKDNWGFARAIDHTGEIDENPTSNLVNIPELTQPHLLAA
jgi:hypothetical protein